MLLILPMLINNILSQINFKLEITRGGGIEHVKICYDCGAINSLDI